MIRFGFYGRVSTEDQQDPESSRGWQLTRSRTLIEPRGGVIVAEFFDIDKSRSIPWQRRPHATALLAELKNPDRGLRRGGDRGAAPGVLRQPVRADVPAVRALRRAAVGARGRRPDRPGQRGPRPGHVRVRRDEQGRAEPDQDPRPHRHGNAGRRSKAVSSAAVRPMGTGWPTRGRTRTRPRPQTASGPARAGDRPRGGSGRPADLRRVPQQWPRYLRHRREADPRGDPLPVRARPGPQPAPVRHRLGQVRGPRRSCANPRYTGHQVWNRQRKDEVLLDVDDVALGYDDQAPVERDR